MVEALIEFSKANECHTQMTLASQSYNTELAQASLAVTREKEPMDVVSMYLKKLKEAWAEIASNEWSQKCDGNEYQENVSFVSFFKARILKHCMLCSSHTSS